MSMSRVQTGGIDTREHSNIHAWIRYHFGEASECWNPFCKDKYVSRPQWALIRGLQYARKATNFVQLCSKCHWHYDRGNGEWAKKVREGISELAAPKE